MPINKTELHGILNSMKSEFKSNPDQAVRSKRFINMLHQYCIDEIKRHGISDAFKVEPEIKIYGSRKPKNFDVVVYLPNGEPLIAIAIKSQMSSVGKNVNEYYEKLIGEVSDIHNRHPFLVIGRIYLFPLEVIKEGKEEDIDFDKIEKMFSLITNRKDWNDAPDNYEHLAMLVVDFNKSPPQIVNTIPKNPDLRIEKFFDKLLETYEKRNPFLLIN